jgi:hypothetical protein
LQKYFARPGIKLIGETNKQGQQVKVLSKADRNDFKEFLFYVVGKCQRSDLGKRIAPVCPKVLCGIVMAYGIQLVNKTGLLRIVDRRLK